MVGWRFPGVEVGLDKFVAKDRWIGGWDAAGWVAVATAHVQAASKDRCRRKGGGREEGRWREVCHERRKAGRCVSALTTSAAALTLPQIIHPQSIF